MSDSAARFWADQLAAWAIPAEILDAAPESPYGFPVGMFGAPAAGIDTPSHRLARAAMPAGGTVLDVGCGGGAGAFGVVPPAAVVVGVDSAEHMLTAFAGAAQERGVEHREVLGGWPEVAQEAGPADVVVAHHVTYNVPELVPFARALDAAARRRVVIEMTDVHPWVPTNQLWRQFHDLARPSGPTAALCADVLLEAGFDVHVEQFRRPARRSPDRAATVAFLRRRLCLSADRDAEIDAALPADYEFIPRQVVTIWWDR